MSRYMEILVGLKPTNNEVAARALSHLGTVSEISNPRDTEHRAGLYRKEGRKILDRGPWSAMRILTPQREFGRL